MENNVTIFKIGVWYLVVFNFFFFWKTMCIMSLGIKEKKDDGR
jgi:hypothetical protein